MKYLKNVIKGKKMLEVGVGTGRLSLFFAKKGFDVTGIDISEKMLDVARERAKRLKVKVKLIQMNAEKMDFQSNSFDFIICDRTFKFILNPQKFLKCCRNILRNKGRLLISYERKGVLRKIIQSRSKLPERLYSDTEMKKLLLNSNFRIIKHQRIYFFPSFIIKYLPPRFLSLTSYFDINFSNPLSLKGFVVAEKFNSS
jgi:ubiquinone/menaquinone biosynthesis C-methylase UbiE